MKKIIMISMFIFSFFAVYANDNIVFDEVKSNSSIGETYGKELKTANEKLYKKVEYIINKLIEKNVNCSDIEKCKVSVDKLNKVENLIIKLESKYSNKRVFKKGNLGYKMLGYIFYRMYFYKLTLQEKVRLLEQELEKQEKKEQEKVKVKENKEDIYEETTNSAISVIDRLGKADKYAKIRFFVISGKSDIDGNVIIKKIILEEAQEGGVTIRNDDNETVASNVKTAEIKCDNTDNKCVVKNGDVWEFKAESEGVEIRIVPHGIIYEINGIEFRSSNKKVLDFGEYIR